MSYRTSEFNIIHTGSASINAWYGPWKSLEEVNALAEELGLDEPKDGVKCAIKGEDGVVTQYIYYNHAWYECGGIADAPSDGKLYGRKDAGWDEVTGEKIAIGKDVGEISAGTSVTEAIENVNNNLSDILSKLVVDSELNADSTNPVQNKVITNILTFS